jgi:hypothetical protein
VGLIWAARQCLASRTLTAVVLLIVTLFLLLGFFSVAPDQGRVPQLVGDYKAAAREPGLSRIAKRAQQRG